MIRNTPTGWTMNYCVGACFYFKQLARRVNGDETVQRAALDGQVRDVASHRLAQDRAVGQVIRKCRHALRHTRLWMASSEVNLSGEEHRRK